MFRKILSVFLAAVFLLGIVFTFIKPAEDYDFEEYGDIVADGAGSEVFAEPEQPDYIVSSLPGGDGDDPPGLPPGLLPGGRNYGQENRFVPDEVLAPADSQEHAEQIASAYGLELKSYAYGIAVLLTTDPESEVARSASMSLEDIPELSLNFVYELFEVSYSTGERERSALNEPENDSTLMSESGQWHRAEMDIDRAHALATGEGVIVAVIDTGIDPDHPAFTGRILENSYNSHTNEIGLAFVQDDNKHGTHVSGIIAAARDITNDVVGTAPDAEIMTIKANNPEDTGAFRGESILRGINYAVDKGAKIINMSLGRPFIYGPSDAEHKVIINAVNKGVLVVCSAGNNRDSNAGYPAAYPEAVAVSATRQSYKFEYQYSNYGPQIEISAPGTNIFRQKSAEDI